VLARKNIQIKKPYRKPTQVDKYKYTKALERIMVKELGKITL